MRTITYSAAIREAFSQVMHDDERVVLLGQGLWSPWYVGASMTDIDKEFGRDRVLDTPISENAVTGAAVGAAAAGLRPIVVHPRMDFMLLAVDPLLNQAANWAYLFNSEVPIPLTVRAIINRGGEQGAQHSQALQAIYHHCPGLKVVMPATAADAKQLLVDAVADPNPVIYIDDRWLYEVEGPVPERCQPAPLGRAAVLRPGRDLTIVGISFMLQEALRAADELAAAGIEAEVVDLRCVSPWDRETVFASVRRTGRLLVAEASWMSGGIAADLVATVACSCFDGLRAAPVRVALPDCPAPCAASLEAAYYPRAATVIAAAEMLLGRRPRHSLLAGDHTLPGSILA
jgi:pyruvate dehydrogenase E1 component beta subunit